MRRASDVVFSALLALVVVACGGSESGDTGGAAGSGQGCGGSREARLLAQGEVPHTIAVSDTHVFWTDVKWVGGNGEAVVRMVPKEGGTVDELALEAGVRFYAIAVKDQTVYFTSEVMNGATSGRILSASTQDHAGRTELASGQYAPRELELSNTGLVWVNISGADRVGHVFHQAPVGGAPLEIASDPLDSWTELELSNEQAFWTSTAGTPRLSRASLGGGGASVVTEGAEGGPIECVAVDGSDVYFSRRGTSTNTFEPQYNHDGSVHKVAATGGAPSLLASNQESPSSGLATRDGFLYWVNDDGSVFKLPTAGGTTERLVPPSSDSAGAPTVCSLVLDECHAYFLYNRAIHRVRR